MSQLVTDMGRLWSDLGPIKIILMMSISTFRSYVDTDGDDQPNDQDGRQPYKAQPILDSFQPRALEPCRP